MPASRVLVGGGLCAYTPQIAPIFSRDGEPAQQPSGSAQSVRYLVWHEADRRGHPVTKLSPSGAVASEPLDLASTDPRTSKLIGQHVGNYVIDRQLARGGMGAVFVAKHPRLGREVAVKFLDAEISARVELSQRFLSEAQVTASLNHPNIVDILDFGELEGRLYYVMELLRGQSLAAHMEEHGRFSLSDTFDIIRQICNALEAAHGAGVVHRDLKPANIIVLEGSPVRIKLVDFGVAKLMTTNEGHTRNGQVLGTPSHMAPEQAMGNIQLITPQTDLYSLGVIAFEMLTGAPPFEHESEFMLMIMHVRDPVPSIRERVGSIPESVADLIEGCLAKSPKDRPRSAQYLGEQLRSALEEAPALNQGLDDLQVPTRLRKPPSAQTNFGATLAHSGDRTQLDGEAVGDVGKEHSETAIDFGELGTSVEAAVKNNRARLGTQPTLHSERDLGAPEPVVFSPVDPGTKTLASAGAMTTKSAPTRALERAPLVVPLALHAVEPARAESARLQPVSEQKPEPAAATLKSASADAHELSGTGQGTLDVLMARLQRKGDFPAFAQSVGEVSVKADANSAFSASQLGESILKDYALTAKLLRVINSTYGGRFGGKIFSIRHAIVLLGFDRIRSLALGISLFKSAGKGGQSRSVSDSAVASIVSGEIARSLAGDARVNDEEAMVCGMFRNLGRHLVIVYLPEFFEKIQQACAVDRLSERAACERVLGISFSKVGAAVAQNWHLPPGVIGAISARTSSGSAMVTSEDRSNALAEFANELCEIIASESPATRGAAISDLLGRHRRLLTLNEADVLKLVSDVEGVFQQRYAAVLGLETGASRFLTNVAIMNAPPGEAPASSSLAKAHERGVSHAHDEGVSQVREVIIDQSARAKPVVARLELGRKPAQSKASQAEVDRPLTPIESEIEKVRAALACFTPADQVLNLAFKTWSQHTGLKRLLLLVATPSRDELVIRAGLHEDLDALTKELRLGIKPVRGASNVFQNAYNSVKDVVVPDVFLAQATSSVPQRYYEMLGSTAFALYACGGKGCPAALLLAHTDSAELLATPTQLQQLAALKPLFAQAAARK